MPNRHARTMQVWEDVAASLQRIPAKYRGESLGRHDSMSHAVAIACQCCLFADLRAWHEGIREDRTIIGWAHDVRRIDAYDLACYLGDAISELRLVREPTTLASFQQKLDKYPFHGMFVSPFKVVLSEFLAEPSPRLFALCSQAFSFLTRLSLREIDFSLDDEYVAQELDLQSYTPPNWLLDALASIVEQWLSDISLTDLPFRHGKGAVATLSRSNSDYHGKLRSFGTDALLDYVLTKYAGGPLSEHTPFTPGPLDRTCEIVTVPKSMKTRRIISKEPAALQYVQQGVRKALYKHIENHPYLGRHINFAKQEHNGALALLGSKDHQTATIDLSSASDYVSWHIVRKLFGRTSIYPFLVASRSRKARLSDGRVIELAKFAPMGSALCFPIQTLVFAAAVEYAYRRARVTPMVNPSTWRVYGDDIIVEDDEYQNVVLVLQTLGLKVNSYKSYASPYRFRESCGVEAYDGEDVTPLRISRGFYIHGDRITSYHASQYESLVDMANACFDKGYYTLRSFVLRMIFANDVGQPFFAEGGRGGIHSSSLANNWRAPKRWNADLQCMEVQVCRPVVQTQDKGWFNGRDRALLIETLRAIEHRSGDMFSPDHLYHVQRGTVTSSLELVWTRERPLSELVR